MTNVFLLDDEPFILEALKRALAPLRLEVKASNLWSEVASPLVRAGSAAAILVCDLELPGIRGAEFCRIVRRHNPNVKIIIFSGKAGEAPMDVADAVIDKSKGVVAVAEAVRRFARDLGDVRPTPVPVANAPPIRGKRALVVDDEPAALTAARMALQRAGFAVTTAASVAEALPALSASDIVLADVRLGPGGSGLDVLAAAKARVPPLPVVLFSAFGDAETLRRAFRLHCDDFLDKPVDSATLVKAMERVLHRPASSPATSGSDGSQRGSP